MLCPNCGQELSDLDTICPACKATVPTRPAEPTGSYGPPPCFWGSPDDPGNPDNWLHDQEAAPQTAAEDTTKAPANTSEPPQKRSPLPIILTAIIALLAVAVVILTISLTTLSSTGKMPSFVVSISDWFEKLNYKDNAVAIQITDQNGDTLTDVTNAALSYYYWGEIYYYIQNSGIPFDADQPLSEQSYDDTQSWQDYFVQSASNSMVQIEALKAMAEADGFTMPEDYQTEYDSTISSMESYAVQTGFTHSDGTGDVLAYIQDSYGASATEEGFQQYLYDSYYVTAYSDTIYEGLTFTDQEIEDYFDENSALFTAYGLEKSDTPNVNVRHILIAPEKEEDETEASDEAWDEAKEQAEEILADWKSGEATEESFAALAQEHSTDNADDGGLYEDVYPGQMVEEFNDWCFDDKRAAGDTGIVKTRFGYHIIYYVSATENYYWKDLAENELHYTRYQETLASITEQYTATPTDKLQLPTPDALANLAQQSSTGAAG